MDDLLQQIAQAEADYASAKEKLDKAHRTMVDAESLVIELAITLGRLKDQLRILRKSTPSVLRDERETEIEGFRQRFPGLCQEAHERDVKKRSE
jgi:hypothetical protein